MNIEAALLAETRLQTELLGKILRQLQLSTLGAAGVTLLGSSSPVTLDDPAVNPRSQLIAETAKTWRVVRVYAISYQQNGVYISRSKTSGNAAGASDVVADGVAKAYLLAPTDSLYAAGIGNGGKSTLLVGITPVDALDVDEGRSR